MAVHFISGKPRGGKSLYSVKLMVEELVHGTRPILTNVPLNLGRLNEYLQEKYPDRVIDVVGRVHLLSDAQTREFFTYRPGGVRIARLSKDQWSAGELPNYHGVTDQGVFYAIDEIHNFFNARAWAETGRDVLFYLSQHGHLGDTVIAITQHIGNVDKQFRSVSQDYTYVRNMKKEKLGVFRMPGVFLRKTYLQPATERTEAVESGTFKLDVTGLASCYSTVGGVGIHSRGDADKNEKQKGLPWWIFLIGVPVLLLLLLTYAPKLVSWVLSPSGGGKQVLAAVAPGALAPSPSPSLPAAPSSNQAPAAVVAAAPAVEISVRGGMVFGDQVVIAMSDGSVRRSLRGEVVRNSRGPGYFVLGYEKLIYWPGP